MKFKICVFFCYITATLCAYQLEKVDIPKDDPSIKFFSHEELALYDGSDPDKPIYMSVKGVVFDVSKGSSFYGKGTSYNDLVGKDASRAVALMSLDPKDLNNDLTGLSDQTLKSLDDIYKGTYKKKYPIAGYMDFLKEDAQQKSDL